jgi:hypothetical protein
VEGLDCICHRLRIDIAVGSDEQERSVDTHPARLPQAITVGSYAASR